MAKKPLLSAPGLSDSPRYGALEFDWPYKRPATKREVAETVRCTERFLEREVNRGSLRAVRLGLRSVRFLPSDIIAWLNARGTIEELASK
jgi:excisionase family DNA binding protein